MLSRPHYVPTLDGWRALAILLVLSNHDVPHRVGAVSTTWLAAHGGFGVDVFFAISGFLICTLLLEEEQHTGTISLRSFYTRRAFRILPAAITYLVTIACLRVSGLITAVHPAEWFGSLFFFRNLQPMGPGHWYTSHFWSLSVEEHFYFILPALLLLLRPADTDPFRAARDVARSRPKEIKRGFILFILGIVILPAGLYLSRHNNPLLFTDYKLGAIFLAAAAAVLLRNPAVQATARRLFYPAVIVPIATAAMLIIPGRKALLVLPFLFLASVISTVLHPSAAISRFLESRSLRFIGKRSYSLYLWQQLFLSAHFGPVDLRLQHWPVSIICTFAVACLSYALIEHPMIRLGHRIARPTFVSTTPTNAIPALARMQS